MQKDVLYIDVEDDITAIIGKVKEAKHHIVALVPPKRIGAIQSAVNLKLVHRAAEQANKRLVIISNNAALMALAGSAGIPVAKNLQSKPELAEVAALDIDDGEDIIDGADVPPLEATEEVVDPEDASVATVSKPASSKKATTVSVSSLGATALAAKDKVKIPNFDTFRKKLFIGLTALALLIGFLVWAIVFAPSARIVITARTTDAALNSNVTFGPALATDLKAGTIKSEVKTLKKDVSIPLAATGKKDVGTKATGTVKFVPTSPMVFLNGATIPAGTSVTASGGSVYTTDAAVVFDSDAPASSLAAGKTVSVTAAVNGASYNGATGSANGPSGFSTTFTTPTSGGTDKTITVIQQSDVDKVSGDILKSGEAEAAKAELKKQFADSFIVIDASFASDTSAVKPTPAVDAESTDGKGVLAGPVTFTLVAIAKSEAGKYLDAYFAQQIDGKSDQKVYSNGLSAVSLTNISAKDGNYQGNISTNGKLGPKIDEVALKEFIKGKRFGDIQTHVQSISGVENVDVKMSPFWVSSAPNDTSRIAIEFKVND